jgi:hypothetical protein
MTPGLAHLDARLAERLGELAGEPIPGTETATHRALLGLCFPAEAAMWRELPRLVPPGESLLTHDNRHLYMPDRVRIVHMDDWWVSRLYGEPWEIVREALVKSEVRYYLEIPNERNHPVLRDLCLAAPIRPGAEEIDARRPPSNEWTQIGAWGDYRLFQLKTDPDEKTAPQH